MKPRPQLILGVLNSMATALAMLIMAPVYLQYLGVEAYGLIGFYTTLLMCMQVFDMGMATTLNREIARHGVGRLSEDNAQLLRCVELIYAAISVALVSGMWILGAWFAKSWFTATNITGTDITYALYGIGTCVALRLPINVYQSALFGAQKMHLASAIGIFQVFVGALGSYVLLRFYSADVVTVFVWQAVIALLHLFFIRTVVWHHAPGPTVRRMDWRPLRDLWRYAVGAGLISIAGLVLSQVDKVVLSKTLDLEHYGYYMLGTTLAACMYMLVAPVYNVFFPLVSKLIAQNKTDELLATYQLYSALLASCVFPLALFLVLFFPQLVDLWLHNPYAIKQVSSIASVLVVAATLHAVMHLPHALIMASGVSKTYLAMYLGLIMLSFPITIFLSIQYGAVGGAWGQIVLFVSYAVAGTWITHRYCLKGYALHWLLKDIGRPLGVVAFFALGAYAFELQVPSHFGLQNVVVLVFALLLLSGLCVLTGPNSRSFFICTMRSVMSKFVGKYS
jgi:O-antigen/teichoic acid export membrane protein